MNTIQDKNKAVLGVSKQRTTGFAAQWHKLSESLPQNEICISQEDVNKEVKAVRKARSNTNSK